MSLNKVILIGNLGKDPVVRKLDNGRAVAQFSLATHEKYKDKSGQSVENTEWHNVVLWTPLAEIAERFLKKGSQVYIEGKITTREYTDKDNVNRRTTEIIGREMVLLGSPQATSSDFDKSFASEKNTSKKEIEDIGEIASPFDDELPF